MLAGKGANVDARRREVGNERGVAMSDNENPKPPQHEDHDEVLDEEALDQAAGGSFFGTDSYDNPIA